MLSSWLKKEEFNRTRFGQRLLEEEEVYICEPEQRVILGKEEDENDNEKTTESFMEFWKSSDQHVKMMSKASNKARTPRVYKTDNLCMVVSCINNGRGQLLEVVMKTNEDKGMLLKIKECF